MRIILLLLTTSLFALEVRVSSPHVILMNAKSGRVLYEKGARVPVFPASTTKVASALYALKLIDDLDREVTCPAECLVTMKGSLKEKNDFKVPAYYLEPDGTHYYLREGETISLKALIYGMMLCSGNDASNLVAPSLAGSIPNFVEGLGKFLESIGCENTHFQNPHGLFYPTHQTTSYDLALIAKEAFRSKQLMQVMGTFKYMRPKTNRNRAVEVEQFNALIQKGHKFYYPKVVGGKSGYTSKCGYNLIVMAKDANRSLIVVINKAKSKRERYRDVIALLDAGFNEKMKKRLLFNREESIFRKKIPGLQSTLKAGFAEDIFLEYFRSEEPKIRTALQWDKPRFPIQNGDRVGFVKLFDERDVLLLSVPLIAVDDPTETLANQLRRKLVTIIPYAKWPIMLFLIGCVGFIIYRGYRDRNSKSSDSGSS